MIFLTAYSSPSTVSQLLIYPSICPVTSKVDYSCVPILSNNNVPGFGISPDNAFVQTVWRIGMTYFSSLLWTSHEHRHL